MKGDPEHDALLLDSATKSQGMKLLTEPGTITYSRSTNTEEHSSTIDLAFGDRVIASRDPQWSIVNVAGFESDHRVTQISFDITPYRTTSKRLNIKKANRDELRSATKEALKSLDRPPLPTIEEADEFADSLGDRLTTVMDRTVPLTKPRGSRPNFRKIPRPKYSWRKYVARRTKDLRGMFSICRVAKRLTLPAKVHQLERLVVGNAIHTATEEMGQGLRDEIWGATGDEPTHIPLPHLDAERVQHPSPQTLKQGEVFRLIKRLKSGKAAGDDRVVNEFLKWTKDIILPYLEHLFQACLVLGHQPRRFKHAITVICKKPDKEDYTLPSSWRPIAYVYISEPTFLCATAFQFSAHALGEHWKSELLKFIH